MKHFFKFTLLLLGTFIIVSGIAEGIFYYRLLSSNMKSPSYCDCVVIFPEGGERFLEGSRLVNEGNSKCLTIAGWDVEKLEWGQSTYQFNFDGEYIEGGLSRSTFEDVLAAKRISEQNGFTSITIVTSNYHIPRSYFLSYFVFRSTNIKFKLHAANSSRFDPENWLKSSKSRKMLFSEMIKFWGSAFELIIFQISGVLLNDIPILKSL
jgi:DUF218 domain